MRGLFVTGTDTGVGKTLVAAILVRALDAAYWKPLQTGLADEPGDSETVARLAAPRALHPPAYALAASLSPEAAAQEAGVTIEPARLILPPTLPPTLPPIVVEGAGGVLVPITRDMLMIDLIERFALPVIVVARTSLGTINHTLLTLHALRARAVPILGIVLNGPPNAGNRAAIQHHGATPILAELPRLDIVDAGTIRGIADEWQSLLLNPL